MSCFIISCFIIYHTGGKVAVQIVVHYLDCDPHYRYFTGGGTVAGDIRYFTEVRYFLSKRYFHFRFLFTHFFHFLICARSRFVT